MKRLFTLIELIVVIVVLGILAAIVIPNISSWKNEAKQTAIIADVSSLQTASDLYSLDNSGKPPLANNVTMTNPRLLDLNKLEGDYLRNIPKHEGINYWLDYLGKVWYSTIDAPIDIENNSGVVTWSKVEGAESYNVYEVSTGSQGTAKGKTYKMIDTVYKEEYTGVAGGEYLISAVDKGGMESVPVGPDYLGLPFVMDNKSNLRFYGEYDEYVEVGHHEDFNLTEKVTVEAWVYPEAKSNYYRTIVSKGYHHSEVFQLRMGRTSDGSYASFEVGYSTRTDKISLPDNQWTHLVGYYDGNEVGLYVNGELLSIAKRNPDHIIKGNEDPVLIGGNMMKKKEKSKNEGEPDLEFKPETWNGYIDEVRIWDHVRTKEQILNNYNKELTGNEEGLVGYWNFNEGQGDTIYDKTSNGFDGKIIGNLKWVKSK